MSKLLPSLFRAALVLLATGLPLASRAQTPAGLVRSYPEHKVGFRCAFDSAQQAAFARQPGAEVAYRAFLQQVAALPAAAQARLLATPDVTVPVVVHIIHTGGSDNISDAQVNDAIRVINADYSKRNADTASVIRFFQGRYANIGFQMKLARLDPNGNCTTGITRTFSTDTNIGDERVKSLIVWDQSKYLNIWVCNNANGAGGYAYLPCTGGTGDGIVIRNAQFGGIGNSGGSNLAVRSLTHEIGHYFGLPHTWGGSNTPGLASNCGIDDGIADTPNTIGLLYGCDLNFSPCLDPVSNQPVLANVQNYMDYAGCTCMFTLGQRAVMRASLQQSCRQQLTTPANLLATGTNDSFTGGPCAPVVAFEANNPVVCEGSSVTFSDFSYNVAQNATGLTYAWQFPGGTPATSSLRAPTVAYPTGGVYNVTLTITGAGGTGTATRTGLVQVMGGSSGLNGTVAESFENPGFPLNYPAPDLRNWSQSSTSTAGAAKYFRVPASPSLVVSDGQACLLLRSSLLPAGTQTRLVSPNIDLRAYTAAPNLALTFDRAYALRPAPVSDLLSVQFSTDCGVSWQTQRTFFAAELNTRDTLRVYGYSPLALSEWAPLRVEIPAAYRLSHFQLRLVGQSNGGNNLFLDKLAVTTAAPLAAAAAHQPATGLRVFPNPATRETAVEFTVPTPGPVELRLSDLLGRPVQPPRQVVARAGRQTVTLLAPGAAGPAPGLYLVELRREGTNFTGKVVFE